LRHAGGFGKFGSPKNPPPKKSADDCAHSRTADTSHEGDHSISQKGEFPKFNDHFRPLEAPKMTQNPPNFGSQNGKAKSQKAKIVSQIARIVRREGLDYDGWRIRQKGLLPIRPLRTPVFPAFPCLRFCDK
jgi:hypothetical protein